MGSLFGNVDTVLANESVKTQDKLMTKVEDIILGLLGGTILSAFVFTGLRFLEHKDQNLVNQKLKEYRRFSRNAHKIYDEIRLRMKSIDLETVLLEEYLENFLQLLVSFESEIDRVQFWSDEAHDCTEAKRKLSKKIVVKNTYQSSLVEVDLGRGLYYQEELTLDEFKTRIEGQWEKITEEYQKLIEESQKIVSASDEEETLVDLSSRENESLPSSSQGIPRGCQDFEHLYGQV